MSTAAASLLKSFESLSKEDQCELASAILRRSELWDGEPLSDDDLVRLADERFCELDAEEERHGQSA